MPPTASRRVPVLVAVCSPVWSAGDETPPAHAPLNVWREWQQIREAIRMVPDPATSRLPPLHLVRLNPPTLARLREVLGSGRGGTAYAMVHLIGYADPSGVLRMEQDNGREELVTPVRLAQVFRGAGVRIALLNVCFGVQLAEALVDQAGVLAAVAPRGEISDLEAIVLARTLYLRLAAGDPIGKAFSSAREAIRLDYCQNNLPRLDPSDDRPLPV